MLVIAFLHVVGLFDSVGKLQSGLKIALFYFAAVVYIFGRRHKTQFAIRIFSH